MNEMPPQSRPDGGAIVLTIGFIGILHLLIGVFIGRLLYG